MLELLKYAQFAAISKAKFLKLTLTFILIICSLCNTPPICLVQQQFINKSVYLQSCSEGYLPLEVVLAVCGPHKQLDSEIFLPQSALWHIWLGPFT